MNLETLRAWVHYNIKNPISEDHIDLVEAVRNLFVENDELIKDQNIKHDLIMSHGQDIQKLQSRIDEMNEFALKMATRDQIIFGTSMLHETKGKDLVHIPAECVQLIDVTDLTEERDAYREALQEIRDKVASQYLSIQHAFDDHKIISIITLNRFKREESTECAAAETAPINYIGLGENN